MSPLQPGSTWTRGCTLLLNFLGVLFIVVDPDSKYTDTDPDPAFQVNPDPYRIRFRIQSFDEQKLKKKSSEKIKMYLFKSKIANFVSLGLLKGRPSYRRLSAFKRKHPARQK
jgi:hypothetical protein